MIEQQQLSFDCAMKIVNKQKWIQIKDIERLEKFIQNQQAIIEQQEQSITILKQEIADTQAILEMLSDKLKGWNNE